ncbi:hypothetical protein [Blastomonas aquatica]|uniref:HEPN domain-containing protein n=1 Tax=Blastomonas aquatica TaxID=1510276 RepID=A0ABQ1J1Q6_9SPHN|nr:hypothetical protein [Blastomonas aquatica]GGB57924.1 hypothetical protein GCM10010833_10880 [Blastomonas aquatica]
MPGSESAAAEAKLNLDSPSWKQHSLGEEQKRIITAQAYYMRADRSLNERIKLEECLPMARALFGPNLEEAVETLHHQFHIVLTYADAYIDDHNGTDRDFTLKIRRALFASKTRSADEVNEVSDAIEQSVKAIEETCLPYLRLEQP